MKEGFRYTDRIPDKTTRNLLSWKHSGFNINISVRLNGFDNKAREALAQNIARCLISQKKLSMNQLKAMCPLLISQNSFSD
jgi:hypothetical protein